MDEAAQLEHVVSVLLALLRVKSGFVVKMRIKFDYFDPGTLQHRPPRLGWL